jgi:Ca2+-binding EF-hand superfamily protein
MTIRPLLCAGLALSCLGALPLMAAQPGAEGQHHHPANEHDARLSDERIAEISARLAERPQLFARIDQNGDGQLSRGELISARARSRQHHGQEPGELRDRLKKRFDADGDGSLSDTERATAREALAEHRDRPQGEDLRDRLEDRADTNGDGSIDDTERAVAKAAIQARIEERVAKLKAERPELFARLDQNGDGSLDHAELRHAKALHQRRHGDHGVRDHGRGEGRARRGAGGEPALD